MNVYIYIKYKYYVLLIYGKTCSAPLRPYTGKNMCIHPISVSLKWPILFFSPIRKTAFHPLSCTKISIQLKQTKIIGIRSNKVKAAMCIYIYIYIIFVCAKRHHSCC